MEMLLKFNYFHIIIDEVALIGSQGSCLFLRNGVGALAGMDEKQHKRRQEQRAQRVCRVERPYRACGAKSRLCLLGGSRSSHIVHREPKVHVRSGVVN